MKKAIDLDLPALTVLSLVVPFGIYNPSKESSFSDAVVFSRNCTFRIEPRANQISVSENYIELELKWYAIC